MGPSPSANDQPLHLKDFVRVSITILPLCMFYKHNSEMCITTHSALSRELLHDLEIVMGL